jgi:hypothetical protein
MTAMIELHDARGIYVHPTAEQVAAANLSGLELELWQAVERCNAEAVALEAALADARKDVDAKMVDLAEAEAALGRARPRISPVEAARMFIRATRRG